MQNHWNFIQIQNKFLSTMGTCWVWVKWLSTCRSIYTYISSACLTNNAQMVCVGGTAKRNCALKENTETHLDLSFWRSHKGAWLLQTSSDLEWSCLFVTQDTIEDCKRLSFHPEKQTCWVIFLKVSANITSSQKFQLEFRQWLFLAFLLKRFLVQLLNPKKLFDREIAEVKVI